MVEGAGRLVAVSFALERVALVFRIEFDGHLPATFKHSLAAWEVATRQPRRNKSGNAGR